MAQPVVVDLNPAPEQTWVDRLAQVIERLVPDALTTAIALMVALVSMGFLIGSGAGQSLAQTATQTFDAYYQGLWMFLQFTMQMTLILVLSLIVGATPMFRSLIAALSRIPRTQTQVVVGTALCGAAVAYLNWGLSLALGPLIAMHFCREAERKGIPVDFMFILAVIAGVGSIWQFGLSASAPLLMATPTSNVAQQLGVMSLDSTIWAPAAVAHVVVFLGACVAVGVLFMPRRVRPISEFTDATQVADASGAGAGEMSTLSAASFRENPAQWLERSSWVLLPLIAMLGSWLYTHFFVKGLSLDINATATALLLGGLILHRTVGRFQGALKEAVTLAWPIVVLYHLYAGVAGLIQFTPVGPAMASVIAPISNQYTFPFLTALISTVVAIFIPTSGGQWAIQGFVTVSAAEAAGVTAQRGLLALSIGDHMGNLLTPFWAVVGAGIARVDFRLFFGYRLIFAALWFVIGVVSFTFLPC